MFATIWMCTHEWSLMLHPGDGVHVCHVPPALELRIIVHALEQLAQLAVAAHRAR